MITLNSKKILKIFGLISFIFSILTPFIFINDDAGFSIEYIYVLFLLGIVLPFFILLIIILSEMPLFFSYKKNFYSNESRILESGFESGVENEDDFFKLSIKTYKKEVDNIYISFRLDGSIISKRLPYLLFKGKDEITNERIFYFFRNKSRSYKKYDVFFDEYRYYINLENEQLDINLILEGFDAFDIEEEKKLDK